MRTKTGKLPFKFKANLGHLDNLRTQYWRNAGKRIKEIGENGNKLQYVSNKKKYMIRQNWIF